MSINDIANSIRSFFYWLFSPILALIAAGLLNFYPNLKSKPPTENPTENPTEKPTQ